MITIPPRKKPKPTEPQPGAHSHYPRDTDLSVGSSVHHKTRGRGSVIHINGPESVTVRFDDGTALECNPKDLK